MKVILETENKAPKSHSQGKKKPRHKNVRAGPILNKLTPNITCSSLPISPVPLKILLID